MGLNTSIDNDLPYLYKELKDATAVYNGVDIDVIFDTDYEVSSIKEKVVRVQSKDVAGLSNGDVITMNGIDYKVITFQVSPDSRETTIGLEK